MKQAAVFATFMMICAVCGCAAQDARPPANPPDLILHNAKILTVDQQFSIAQAIAIKDGRILAVGSNKDVLKTRGPQTRVEDLAGRTVIPGLIDSHVHPAAAMTEFDHDIPEMESVEDILDYVSQRAKALGPGKWVQVRQIFITRLKDPRYPTSAELDKAAPDNPVVFSTGPDASLNTLALKLSGIDKNFKPKEGEAGFPEKDPATGELTGILRGMGGYIKSEDPTKKPTEEDSYRRTLALFKDYNSVGITTIADRNASRGAIDRYKKMLDAGDLPLRMSLSHAVDNAGTLDSIKTRIKEVANHPLRARNDMLQIVGIKMFLDGGMLTGSAYMRQPWGVSKTYGITDPNYRGTLYIPRQRLLPIVQTAIDNNLQFTAHSVGDGAVHTLLDVYNEISKTTPLGPTRPCITHCNFMSKEAVQQLARLGACADIQPIWLYLDARTLTSHFGYDRLRYFQPLKSLFAAGAIVGGGSDHMQKIGSLRAVNPYNPFLGMYIATTRKARWYDGQFHPEEAITRQQALRFYTKNNAWLLFRENEIGSLEKGKFADLVVLDRDILTCSENDLRDTQALRTYLAGKLIFDHK
jgi:predicted amidohydrolase YtcJ